MKPATVAAADIVTAQLSPRLEGTTLPLIRHPGNPILTREAIPDIPPNLVDVSSVFNPGATVYDGRTILLLRVQNRGRKTFLLLAESADGVGFRVRNQPVELRGLESVSQTVHHLYDPRITRIGDDYFILLAMDLDDGCRLGVARTTDFESFEFIGMSSEQDIRNGVLFPERYDGKYLRLARPNRLAPAGGGASGDEIYLYSSENLIDWTVLGAADDQPAPVLSGRWHYWDEFIGSGPPPVKTHLGWLHIYHGVATHLGGGIYQAGVALLDLDDPSRLLARCSQNILEPRELYEQVGQVPNVVFPSGMTVDRTDDDGFAEPDSMVRVYYGAADSVVCLATSTVRELIAACFE
ncbi:MAG: glycoside hydrolase family 130 protein [bacterium]